MNTERELIQQLRDALNEYQPCDHANTEIVSAGWHDCKQCGELIRPAHYARDREDTARVVDLIAAADAYLSKQDWIRVEDSLPVVPGGESEYCYLGNDDIPIPCACDSRSVLAA